MIDTIINIKEHYSELICNLFVTNLFVRPFEAITTTFEVNIQAQNT